MTSSGIKVIAEAALQTSRSRAVICRGPQACLHMHACTHRRACIGLISSHLISS